MEVIGIIPARYGSTRFPGKPMVMIGEKTMIQRVYEQAKKVLGTVLVATDDNRIEKHVLNFGGEVVMTSEKHQSGTDRCSEAIEKYIFQKSKQFDVIINIQGDEPFIKPELLIELIKCFQDKGTDIATIIKKVNNEDEVFTENTAKVLLNINNKAIYFSRSPIPYVRQVEKKEWHKVHDFYKHIGVYAYRYDVLKKITKLEMSSLEKAEKLEQNRWIENGYTISTIITEHESIAIDTPEDLKRVVSKYLEK